MTDSAEAKTAPRPSALARWFWDNPALAREWSQRFGQPRRPGALLEAARWAGLLTLLALYFLSAWWFSREETDPWTARLGVFVLGALYLGLITAVLPVQAASSIAWEREQDTWQQLLLTQLRPSQLVAAKVVTALWPGVCILLGALPLLLPALHAARFPLDTAAEVLVILAAAPVGVTCAGVWLSLRCRRRATAVALAYLGTGVFLWATLLSIPPWYVRGENLWWYASPAWQVGVLCFATPGWGPLARPLLPEWAWFVLFSAGVSALSLWAVTRRITAETG